MSEMSMEFRAVHDLTNPGSARFYHPEQGFGFVTEENRAAIPRLKLPETNSGFLPQWWHGDTVLTCVKHSDQGVSLETTELFRKEEAQGRLLALCFRQDVPCSGSYRVTVTVTAQRDADEVLLFVGRRRLAWHGSMAAGDSRTVSMLCDVSPIIPRGQEEPVSDSAVTVAVLFRAEDVVCLHTVKVEAVPACTVYIMGDSTVTDQTANLPYAPGSSFAGWGQMLGAFLPEPMCISNHAHSGLTTESFTSGGHWDVMFPLMKHGDICLLQFGHNDQKLPHLTARGGYTQKLNQYIDFLRAVGVKPILVTPLARNSWTSTGKYNDLLRDHAEAVLAVGQAANVPVIDLHGYAMRLICDEGLEYAKRWFYPGDYTHTNDFGAYKMASFVAGELCGILGVNAQPMPVWNCHEPFAALEPPVDCQLTPPEGRADPVAGLLAERPTDFLSRVETLDLVIQLMRYFPINVYNDLYTDVVGHETYAGIVQCAAQNDLVPEFWTADGMLHPNQPVTLADFLVVLMTGYASRHALGEPLPVTDAVPAFAKDAVGLALRGGLVTGKEVWDRPLLRSHAAEICRNVKI